MVTFTGADGAGIQADLVELRRTLHRTPEVGLQIPQTQQIVLDALAGLPLEVSTGKDTTSVIAVLRGGAADRSKPVPAVLLRGDMDGLPVVEQTGLDFASVNGAMHACGHDLHTAGLVGAARLLSARREALGGDVVFMFQPGEEGYDGAGIMLDEGVLEASGAPVIAAYGVHVSADLPRGVFHSRPGPLMAASGILDVTVLGRGGHGSRPQTALDPIQVAAEVVTALQSYISRRFDVFDPVVLTVGDFHGGSAPNVIPDSARFRASVRSFSPAVSDRLETELPALVQGIVQGHGLRAEAAFTPGMPATVNDETEAAFYGAVAAELFGAGRFVLSKNPRTASEDFSRVLERVPGSYGHLGAAIDAPAGTLDTNHSPRAQFDDAVLGDQAVFLAELAARRLARR